MRWLPLVLCLALPCMAHGQTLARDDAALLQAGLIETADAFVLPAYEAQAGAAETLVATLDTYCTGDGALALAQEAFAATFLAWQRSSVIQFGPIADAEGPFRVQLWPDPKGFSVRAVRNALRTKDPDLLDRGGLKGRSIALTNLTALETLLWGDLPPGGFACAFATAIARFQADLAADLATAWRPQSPYRHAFDTAALGNATYPNVDALVREFLAGTVVFADRLRKFKLLRGMGQAPGEARPERTEARISGLGLASIETSFRALGDLYDVPFGLFDVAPDLGGSMEYVVLSETARSVADTIATLSNTLPDIAETDGAEAAILRRSADLVLHQESFLKTGFLQSIGLVAGFTAADGD